MSLPNARMDALELALRLHGSATTGATEQVIQTAEAFLAFFGEPVRPAVATPPKPVELAGYIFKSKIGTFAWSTLAETREVCLILTERHFADMVDDGTIVPVKIVEIT